MNSAVKIKSSGAKRDESLMRKNTLAAISLWYQRQVYLHRANFEKERDRQPIPDIPDEYLRSELFIGPSFKADGVTAHGVETPPSRHSEFPTGFCPTLDIANRDEREQLRKRSAARAEVLSIMEPSMVRLRKINRVYADAVEMWAAGWRFNRIGNEMDVSKNLAHQYFECGVTWLAGCLLTKPDLRTGYGRKPRHAMWKDLCAETTT